MSIWSNLIKYYDRTDDVCPIAHTYITPSVCVLLGQGGELLATTVNRSRDMAMVPCTWQSEARTSNNAPHLLSDNLSYLTEIQGQEARHKKYIDQLRGYLDAEPDDVFALAVYKYITAGTLADDIADLIKYNFTKQRPQGIYIAFTVYGCDETDKKWTDYYMGSLPKNGLCFVTGQPDFIPDTYPAGILSTNDMARLLSKGCGVGYIASQKIIHALQYLCYAKTRRSEAERAEFREDLRAAGFLPEEIWEIEKEILKEVAEVKKIATTQLLKPGDAEIYFNEYSDGSYKKVVDEVETDSSLEELQDMVNSSEYQVTELTFGVNILRGR